MALPTPHVKFRDIAAAITDPGIADLSAAGKIIEILAHLTNPANPDSAVRTDQPR